jgi:hypothetical protein
MRADQAWHGSPSHKGEIDQLASSRPSKLNAKGSSRDTSKQGGFWYWLRKTLSSRNRPRGTSSYFEELILAHGAAELFISSDCEDGPRV